MLIVFDFTADILASFPDQVSVTVPLDKTLEGKGDEDADGYDAK